MNSARKQSILIGGLISTAGIFISKMIGLFYVIPYERILATPQNISYYGGAYVIYSYVLNVATAGLPFAIATLIARYSIREDYHTCLLVRRISFYTMTALGFIAMCFMILFSNGLAKGQVGNESGLDVGIMQQLVILLALGVFIIPILSSIRGFYQGFKEMGIYSTSQIVEQLTRVAFLLVLGFIATFIFHNSTWALYFGVIATSVSGFITILYLKSKDRKLLRYVRYKAKHQERRINIDPSDVFKELVFVAWPFFLIAIFGYSDMIFNVQQFASAIEKFGVTGDEFIALRNAVFYRANKIIAIPMVLAPGFSAAIIPYITTAMEKRNPSLVSKYITECVESVVYIALPLCMALFAFARPIMMVMFSFPENEIEINTFVMQWFALEALAATISPIFSSIVLAIGERYKIVFNTFLFALIKITTNYFLIANLGVAGMVLSSFLAYLVFTIMGILIIQKKTHVNWRYTFRKLIFMCIGLIGFYVIVLIANFFGFGFSHSKLMNLLYLIIVGSLSMITYVAITGYCNVPQSIFNFKFATLKTKIGNRNR